MAISSASGRYNRRQSLANRRPIAGLLAGPETISLIESEAYPFQSNSLYLIKEYGWNRMCKSGIGSPKPLLRQLKRGIKLANKR